jgi:CRISPR/Cas system-associated endonuclease Cas1
MPTFSHELQNKPLIDLKVLRHRLEGQIEGRGFSKEQKNELKVKSREVNREIKRREQQQNEGRKISRPKTKKSCKKRSMNWVSAHKSHSNGKVIKVRGSCRRSRRL